MHWMKAGVLAACVAFGCGTAMGGPDQNQNRYPQHTYGPPGDQNQTYDQQNQNQNQNQNPGNYQNPDENQNPSQGQTDDQAVESFEWMQGQSHLGIVVMGMTRDLRAFFGARPDRGVLVAHVEPRSAAARAGIRVGDVLVSVDGQKVRSADDLIGMLAQQQQGRVQLDVIRNNQRMRLDAMLGRPQHGDQQQQQQNNPML